MNLAGAPLGQQRVAPADSSAPRVRTWRGHSTQTRLGALSADDQSGGRAGAERLCDATTLNSCYGLFHGFSVTTPVAAKSATLRVTTVKPCTSAVAAMKASRSDLRSGTCN